MELRLRVTYDARRSTDTCQLAPNNIIILVCLFDRKYLKNVISLQHEQTIERFCSFFCSELP